MKTKITWTAKNNSSFLNGRRSANSERSAVVAARAYLRGELCGEGKISYFEGDDSTPFRTDEKSIFTKFGWEIKKGNKI